MDTIINTCYISAETSSLVYYSHLIPVFFTLALSSLVFFRAPKNILSKIFLAFSLVFSSWLIVDLITWVSTDYYLIYSFWAPVDYIETVMYILGLYFVIVFVKKKDISLLSKILLFVLTLIPLYITITQNSVLGMDHSYCEVYNNNFLLNYRFAIEILSLIIILFYTILPFLKRKIILNKKSHLLVLCSMFLFLTIFGVTSYISASTAYYELNLYALFITPAFLIAIMYSIFSLDIFNLKIISTYFIVFGFIILTATQLIFVSGNVDRLLTIITIILSIALSIILFKNLKNESDQRIKIEKLSITLNESNSKLEIANDKLKDLDKLKTEFLSLASHQLRSPLTAIKGYTSMILEGDYGEVSDKAKEAIDRILQSSRNLTTIVEDLLNVSKIEQGGMKYEMNPFDISTMAGDISKDLSIIADKKGLKLNFKADENLKYIINGDQEKIRQVLLNLIDNSIKYTKSGQVDVCINKNNNNNNKIIFSVKDTGMGVTDEIKNTLFQKFARGNGGKVNSSGSGLGLYLAKEIVVAHKGRIWVESEGEGKGSTFFVEFNEYVF